MNAINKVVAFPSSLEAVLAQFPGAIWSDSGKQIGGADDAALIRVTLAEHPSANFLTAGERDYRIHRTPGVTWACRLV